jgi:hypothetical protein
MPLDTSSPIPLLTETPPQAPAIPGLRAPLTRLKSMVLLGGSVRQSEFRKAIGRSVLELPIEPNRMLMDVWRDQVASVAELARWQRPGIRLLIDKRSPALRLESNAKVVETTIHLDRGELRGTGGILRDLADEFEDEDYILVANAAQVIGEPLVRIVAAMASRCGDIAITSHDDGSPSSLALIRCGAMRMIRKTGYIDFKEQVLPIVAQTHSVVVVRMPRAIGLPVKSLAEFIRAVRLFYALKGGERPSFDPLAEAWAATFSLVEDPRDVHHSAEIYDSIVLRGARVERNTVLVRSMICPGAVVSAGSTVVDRLVTAD